ncbi:EndoU domain-containing protein [Streptomyces sp. WM6378]|uniref:EndoU domain-containing protein n=1 Tax=Streptomyces sp. WM6378 TaxID=1415557 RepID=UPI00131ADE40|nr:EndoU domain-containing protein [Streptomyces sp. WM6378]
MRPLAKKLEDLQRQAFAFTASIAGDEHWQRDEKKRDRNDGIKDEVHATLQAFYEAEITCHNKITALVGGTTLVLGNHGDKKLVRFGTIEYGATADDLSHLDKAPWGSYAEPEYTGLNWLWHQGKSLVWDGFIVDGVWGTVKGLGTLVGTDGWDAAGQAWTGLGKLATGLVILSFPGAREAFMATPDRMMPKWFRDSRTALKETGKALIAYDEWGKNPARATGAVAFNVLTTVFTGGAGSAAKTGAVAKTVSALGKVGRAVDPMTYVFKAGTFGVGKVADVFKGLKGLSVGPLSDAAHLTHDPNVPHVTDTYAEWSDGTKLSFKDGEYTVTRPDGTVSAAHVELSAADRALLENHLPHQEPVMANAHPGGNSAGHSGDHATGSGSDSGAGSHTPSSGGGHGDPPGTVAGGHGSSGGSGHGTGPHDRAGHGSGSGHGGDPHDPAGHGHSPQDPADPGTGQPVADSGYGGDTSTPDQDPSKVEELPRLPEGGRIPEHTFEHVLQGELKYDRNGNPKIVGYHFRPGGRDLDPHRVKVPKIIEIDHKTGLTTGNVWMRDPRTGFMAMKRAKTTFFPPGWTENQVRRAMEKAFENGRVVDPINNRWRGDWKGIQFEGYFDPITGDAKTIYPLMPKPK